MKNQDIPIELIDTDTYRNHRNCRSHVVLSDDRIIHEAISTCDHYGEDEVVPKEVDYYIREAYRKDAVSGIYLSSGGANKIGKEIYTVNITVMGATEDITIISYDRIQARSTYQTILKWIFDDK